MATAVAHTSVSNPSARDAHAPTLAYAGARSGNPNAEPKGTRSTPARNLPEASRLFDTCAWLALGLILTVALITFRQYGIGWDEQGEVVYGQLLLKYYASGLRDTSAFEFVNFRFYGGGFDLPAALLARMLPAAFGMNEYETRHLLSALIGVATLAAAWRLGRTLAGPRTGLIALLLLALNPAWYGHMFVNSRDLPFAAGLMGCVLFTVLMLDELPNIRLRTALLFGLSLGFSVSVRVGGIIGCAFALVPLGLWFIARITGARTKQAWASLGRDLGRIALAFGLALGVAYAVMALFWPWSVQSPLNPMYALTMFSRFPFDGSVLFEGRVISASHLPATYLPVLLGLTQPELVLCGVGLALAFAVHFASTTSPKRWLGLTHLRIFAVALAAGFPVLYSVLARPVDYNGMRHFLFVLPPLCVVAALGLDKLLSMARAPSLRIALYAALMLALTTQARALVVLHPDQYVYFNSLVGGARGAAGRYELDYWGTSLAEAERRLEQELKRVRAVPNPGQPALRVYVCGNVWSAATYFPAWLKPVDHIEQADFQIAIADHMCTHPPSVRRVLDIKRDGAVLSYVDDLRQARAQTSPRPDSMATDRKL